MKVYTKIVIDMETNEVIEEESFEYEGPLALCGGDGGGGGGGGSDSDDDDSYSGGWEAQVNEGYGEHVQDTWGSGGDGGGGSDSDDDDSYSGGWEAQVEEGYEEHVQDTWGSGGGAQDDTSGGNETTTYEEPTVEPTEPAPVDSDNDGVPDSEDAAPNDSSMQTQDQIDAAEAAAAAAAEAQRRAEEQAERDRQLEATAALAEEQGYTGPEEPAEETGPTAGEMAGDAAKAALLGAQVGGIPGALVAGAGSLLYGGTQLTAEEEEEAALNAAVDADLEDYFGDLDENQQFLEAGGSQDEWESVHETDETLEAFFEDLDEEQADLYDEMYGGDETTYGGEGGGGETTPEPTPEPVVGDEPVVEETPEVPETEDTVEEEVEDIIIEPDYVSDLISNRERGREGWLEAIRHGELGFLSTRRLSLY